MAAKKQKVQFVKRYEDRDKSGNKVVVPAGTVMGMTAAQIKEAGDKVRLVEQAKDESEESSDNGAATNPPANNGEDEGTEGAGGEDGGEGGEGSENAAGST